MPRSFHHSPSQLSNTNQQPSVPPPRSVPVNFQGPLVSLEEPLPNYIPGPVLDAARHGGGCEVAEREAHKAERGHPGLAADHAAELRRGAPIDGERLTIYGHEAEPCGRQRGPQAVGRPTDNGRKDFVRARSR